MLESFPVSLAVGIVLGFLAGMGVGGGSLLLLWLTLVLGKDPGTAGSVNLLFFLPGAIIASLFRLKQGKLDGRRILPALAGAVIAAAAATLLTKNLDTQALRKPFGILLVVTGLRELFYRFRKAR